MPWPTTTIVGVGVVRSCQEPPSLVSRWSRGVGGERLVALPGAGEGADGAEVAEEDPADQAVAADDDLAVGAAGGVGEPDHVVARERGGLAEGGEVEGRCRCGAARG